MSTIFYVFYDRFWYFYLRCGISGLHSPLWGGRISNSVYDNSTIVAPQLPDSGDESEKRVTCGWFFNT